MSKRKSTTKYEKEGLVELFHLPIDPLATIPRLALTSTQVTGNSWPVQMASGAVPFAER